MLVPRVGQRTLWCELPGVVSSGILSILSDKQKQLQEAIFEILTSEVSYLKSLDVLITLFYENDQLIQVLTENDRAALFGNITYGKPRITITMHNYALRTRHYALLANYLAC